MSDTYLGIYISDFLVDIYLPYVQMSMHTSAPGSIHGLVLLSKDQTTLALQKIYLSYLFHLYTNISFYNVHS